MYSEDKELMSPIVVCGAHVFEQLYLADGGTCISTSSQRQRARAESVEALFSFERKWVGGDTGHGG